MKTTTLRNNAPALRAYIDAIARIRAQTDRIDACIERNADVIIDWTHACTMEFLAEKLTDLLSRYTELQSIDG